MSLMAVAIVVVEDGRRVRLFGLRGGGLLSVEGGVLWCAGVRF
tara:strand:+ start:2446 stop:2574 length:129 start_codon:yes stop_codon:yes gene_type:complete